LAGRRHVRGPATGDSLHEAQWSMYFQMPTRIALYENGKIINVRQWKLN